MFQSEGLQRQGGGLLRNVSPVLHTVITHPFGAGKVFLTIINFTRPEGVGNYRVRGGTRLTNLKQLIHTCLNGYIRHRTGRL